MAKRVLAMTKDGEITYCSAPEDKRGFGRCNHIMHQEDGESVNDFISRATTDTKELATYHMNEDEKEYLHPIKGRKDLSTDFPDDDGGFIEVDEPVWSPANITEFSQKIGVPEGKIKAILYEKEGYSIVDGKIVKSDEGETGVYALNRLAEENGYEATTHIYVPPYKFRENLDDKTMSNLNVLYNNIIIKNNSVRNTHQDVQYAYERVLNNKKVKDQIGIKPYMVRGFATDSLADKFNGKKGILRRRVTGFAIPWNSRAVISPCIERKYGEIGVPAYACATIFKPTLTAFIQEHDVPKDKAELWLKEAFPKSGDGMTEENCIRLDAYMRERQCRGIADRQPDLHMASEVCYVVGVSGIRYDNKNDEYIRRDGSRISRRDAMKLQGKTQIDLTHYNKNTIELGCQNAAGFNADFDGDTMQVTALNDPYISDIAWEEMNPSDLLIQKNSADTSVSMTGATKDALFGLYSILNV